MLWMVNLYFLHNEIMNKNQLTPTHTWFWRIWDLHVFKCWDQSPLNFSCFWTLCFEYPSVLLYCLLLKRVSRWVIYASWCHHRRWPFRAGEDGYIMCIYWVIFSLFRWRYRGQMMTRKMTMEDWWKKSWRPRRNWRPAVRPRKRKL